MNIHSKKKYNYNTINKPINKQFLQMCNKINYLY